VHDQCGKEQNELGMEDGLEEMGEERAYRVHTGSRDGCGKALVMKIGVVEKAGIG
jgi:hypothetical protein